MHFNNNDAAKHEKSRNVTGSLAAVKHKVVIVGGGFAGVKTALELSEHDFIDVTLLSDHADFRYYPTLYHTATGGLKAQSSIPLDNILNHYVKRIQTRAEKIDRANKTVVTADGTSYSYDTLVMALGTVTNYFGIEGMAEYSYGIKSIEEVQRFKDHLHSQLANDRKPDLHYVVVGAGPTGIELASALPAYLHKIMRVHGIKHRAVNVELVEAAPRLLPRSSKSTSRAVSRRLKKLSVHVHLRQAVQGQHFDELIVNGKPLKSQTVVWTAGMTNSTFYKENSFAVDGRGKVVVNDYMLAEPNIYVLGDNAATLYSGQAQTALIDAEFASNNIIRSLRNEPPAIYKPRLPISVIPVGTNWAAVEWGSIHFSGRIGWLLRSAADWIGYKDLQPWWKASAQWLTEFGSQEDCITCKVANQEGPSDILQRSSVK